MADEGFQDNFNRWWSHGSTSSNCVATMLHKKYTPRIFGQNQGGASPVTEVLPPAFWAKERYYYTLLQSYPEQLEKFHRCINNYYRTRAENIPINPSLTDLNSIIE